MRVTEGHILHPAQGVNVCGVQVAEVWLVTSAIVQYSKLKFVECGIQIVEGYIGEAYIGKFAKLGAKIALLGFHNAV